MPRRAPDAPPFEELLTQRLTRRRLLQSGAALAPLALGGAALLQARVRHCTLPPSAPVQTYRRRLGRRDRAAARLYTRRADPLGRESLRLRRRISTSRSSPTGCCSRPSAAEHQRNQFGQNCDAIHFFPLDARGDRGVLCVNNEYTDDALMFPGHPGFVRCGARRRARVRARQPGARGRRAGGAGRRP